MLHLTLEFTHYKLAGDFRKRFDEDLNNNTRIPLCQQRHRHYQRFLERQDAPAGSTPAPNLEAQRYEGSAQLQRLGLIDAPARFFSAERRANLDVTTP